MKMASKLKLNHGEFLLKVEGRNLFFKVVSMDEEFRYTGHGPEKRFQAENMMVIRSNCAPQVEDEYHVDLIGTSDGVGTIRKFDTSELARKFAFRLEQALKEWDRDWDGWPENAVKPVNAEDLMDEVMRWKAIAAYLADCQAATAQQAAFTKKYSKSERKRHSSICRKSAEMLKTGYTAGISNRRIMTPEGVEEVIARCTEAADACQDGEPK